MSRLLWEEQELTDGARVDLSEEADDGPLDAEEEEELTQAWPLRRRR